MSTLASTIGRGATGSRPAASEAGRLYYDTTASIWYRDNGSSWDNCTPSALTNPMANVGEIIYGGAAGTPTALAAGTLGYHLEGRGAGVAPAWAGFVGCKVYKTNQSVNNTFLAFDVDDWDTDNFHFTSAANLTGTVAKTAASAAIVGTGTSFTTELTVNQVISIPGTATEIGVVKVITDNTHLTLWANMANTASGQTAARVNTAAAIALNKGGYYIAAASSFLSGTARLEVWVNGAIATGRGNSGYASNYGNTWAPLHLADGDYVQIKGATSGAITFGDAASPGDYSVFSLSRLGV